MYIQLLCYRQPKQVQRGGGHRKLTFQGFISASRPLPEVVSLSRLTCELILLLQWPNVGFFSPILAYQLSETSFCKHMIKYPEPFKDEEQVVYSLAKPSCVCSGQGRLPGEFNHAEHSGFRMLEFGVEGAGQRVLFLKMHWVESAATNRT